MIAGPLLVLGLLLFLSAVAGARVTGHGRGAVAAFLLSPIDPRAWRATWAFIAGAFIEVVAVAVIATIFSIGASLVLALVGIPLIAVGIEVARAFARVERRRIAGADGRPLHPHVYRPYGTTIRDRAEALFLDINRWRDVVYVFVALPLAVLESALVVTLWVASILLISLPLWAGSAALPIPATDPLQGAGVVVGIILAMVAASAARGLLTLHRAVVVGLLCESEQRALERRVETLEVSRQAVLDVEATELRRIERDLHDGAQQRLVMLAMDLGLAAEQIDSDPARARELVLEASSEARHALAELRDLVRGIAPAILMDRGLVPAVTALAGRSPVPTTITSSLDDTERLPESVERAAYYVIAEALANVAKHGSAKRCEIRVRRDDASLVIEVRDDGSGGARIVPNGGLAGLADRVEALDGRLRIDSPAGGPTTIRAEIPLRAAAPGMTPGLAAPAAPTAPTAPTVPDQPPR